jgi:predicted DNA-binding protein YlxM (UPF0122 family)
MTAEIIKPNTLTKKRQNLDTSDLVKLRIDNKLSYQQIADIAGKSKQAIHSKIKKLLPTEDTNIYKNQRADILANLQYKLLSSIDDKDIKKAPVGSRVLAACQIYDKERLERGQSTENIAQIHGDIAKIKAAMQNKSDSGQGD